MEEKQEVKFLSKEYWQKELKEVNTLYFVAINTNCRKFNVYYVKDGVINKVWLDVDKKDKPTYWHNTWGCFYVTGYGFDKREAIARGLSLWLF